MTDKAIAFQGNRRIASGGLPQISEELEANAQRGAGPVVLLDQETGRRIPVNPSDPVETIVARFGKPVPQRSRGRPKLGVVAREVTLLPRHWDWLNAQPGGASAQLRTLVETATAEAESESDSWTDAAFRALRSLGRGQPQLDHALRALFIADRTAFIQALAGWPEDIRSYLLDLIRPQS
ncbi:DUF2239 family protein [Thioclava sp. BHET1]|nr:DUF2239 family protein [Thioclava sp. BHET1]